MTSFCCTRLVLAFLVMCCFRFSNSKKSKASSVVKFVPIELKIPNDESLEEKMIKLKVPVEPIKSLRKNPGKVLQLARSAWKAVVESNPVGLQDAKIEAKGEALAPLSAEEAWHHWAAAQEGVVDSARFLIAFGSATSLQLGGSPLHLAAMGGDVDQLRQLLLDPETMLDVDEKKEVDGTTPLLTAISAGQVSAVMFLVTEGKANVEATGNNQVTPLMLAAALGFVDIGKILLEHGAAVNAQHPFAKTTALHFAAEMGHTKMIQLLCRAGANGNAEKSNHGTPLHSAADSNRIEASRVLVKECKSDVHALLVGDATPLYLAAHRGLTKLCEVMIDELGAQVNFEMPRGENIGSALEAANLKENDPKRTQHSFYKPQNVEIGNGATALHAAAENGFLETVRVLLSRGARSSASMNGATPLVIALQYKHPDIALLILEQDEDVLVNARVPSDGSFALLVAVDLVTTDPLYKTVINVLLAHPVIDINRDNGRGVTALSQAIAKQYTETSMLLLQHNANLFASSPSALQVLGQVGDTATKLGKDLVRRVILKASEQNSIAITKAENDSHAIHSAAHACHERLLREMIIGIHGLDPDLRVISTGATSLMLAAKEGCLPCARLLVEEFNANINARAHPRPLFGATPLYLATQMNHVTVVEYLISHGADPNLALLEHHVTPLFLACERGFVQIARTILGSEKLSMETANSNGLTPIFIAIANSHHEIVQLLISAGAELSKTVNVEIGKGHSEDLTLIRFALHQGNQVRVAVLKTLLKVLADRWAGDELLFHYELIELLRIQSSKTRARTPQEAAEINLMLTSEAEKYAFTLPLPTFFIAMNAVEVENLSRDSHSLILLQSLFSSSTWKEAGNEMRSELLSFRSELTSHLSALQVGVMRGKLESCDLILREAAKISNSLVLKLIREPEERSALSMAQQSRNFQMLKILNQYVSTQLELDECNS